MQKYKVKIKENLHPLVQTSSVLEIQCYDGTSVFNSTEFTINAINNFELNDYKFFLSAVVNEQSFGRGLSGFTMSDKEIDDRITCAGDEGILYIPVDKVVLSEYEDSILFSKVEFFKLCLQFAHKALEAMEVFNLKEKGIVDKKWEEEIKELIPKIEDKVKDVIEKYGDDEEV
jgi:hypothetical protein